MEKRNLTLLTDLYQLTMMQGYFKLKRNETVVFDAFYRNNPSNGGYSIAAGLESFVQYIENMKVTEDDVLYLRTTGIFDDDFLEYLKDFTFTGDVYAMPEGTVIHPMEPIFIIVAPIIEAQFIETTLLNFMNHQSLIATKSSRVCEAAKGDPVMEFGLRRAQGPDAGLLGARAAIIGGCTGTSDVLAAKTYDLKVMGTHAHSWIMSFPNEYEAFLAYATLYPSNAVLLVDTFDTLKSGVPNAIKVFKKLREEGKMPTKYGVRFDSGDLAYFSKETKKMFEKEGFTDVIIVASSDLDEYLIQSLKTQGAVINSWGVGTNLITSKDCPAFGGVYKLAAVEEDGIMIPKIKLSNNIIKVTNPGHKSVWRIYAKETGKAIADVITLSDEIIPLDGYILFDPVETWKKIKLEPGTYSVRELLIPIIKSGKTIYDLPSVKEIAEYKKQDLETFWDELKRFENPQKYYIDLSKNLWDLKNRLLEKEGDLFL